MPEPACTTAPETGPSSLGFETTLDAGSIVVSLTGELDLAGVPVLEAALDALTTADATIVVDLQHLEFIDASGVRLLMQVDRRIRESGGKLFVTGSSGFVSRVFELVGPLCGLVVHDGAPARPPLRLV